MPAYSTHGRPECDTTVTDSHGNTVFTSTPVPITLGGLPQASMLDLGSFNTSPLSAGAYTITFSVEEIGGQVIAGPLSGPRCWPSANR